MHFERHPRLRWMSLWLPLVGIASACAAAEQDGVTLISGSELPAESRAVIINNEMVESVKRAAKPAWIIESGHNPYQETEWLIRFEDSFLQSWNSVTLRIDFFDEGPGVIQPRLLINDDHNGEWTNPLRQVSYTRLNSGQERYALFEFTIQNLDWPKTKNVHLRIAGLQFLRSITAYPSLDDAVWKETAAAVPTTVTPLISLKRPFELTCTVGIPDVGDPPPLDIALDNIREYAPLAKLLGFTSVECYVRWDLIEPRPGEFDFSHYDTLVDAIRLQGLKWYPLLVVTSGYALPPWYFESAENVGLECMEHGDKCHVPSIWNPANKAHVERVLNAFGKHYESIGVLEAVRLGPSGNFGEAQFPAGAGSALGFQSKPMHAHIGWWGVDPFAQADFQRFVESRYRSIESLNVAWNTSCTSFDEIAPQLPQTYRTRRGRLDMTEWYTNSMTLWCEFWAKTARKALPNTPIYQSSGGWGFREAGTDFSGQARSMREVQGGIRLTNETDSFEQNFYATRLAATSARLYDTRLGYEPAGYHSARGVVARFFSTAATNGTNLFTRHSVLFTDPLSIENWIKNINLLDLRAEPVIDVAIYYPETSNQLEDGAFRHLYGWGFNPRAAEIRRRIDVDYLDDRLIRDGFLDRYAVLVFCWGNMLPRDVLLAIDQWIRSGGTAVFPSFPRGDYVDLDGDASIFKAWELGDTGRGHIVRFPSDMEPVSLYGDFIEDLLKSLPGLKPWTQYILRLEHPRQVFFSVLENGTLLTLNYSDTQAEIRKEGERVDLLEPYSVSVRHLGEVRN